MARSVLRKDKVQSTHFGGGHIHNVVFAGGELENGLVGVLGDYLTDERERREISIPASQDDKVVVISHPEVMYDETKMASNSLKNFYREAGETTRAMDLAEGDIISISKEGLTLLDTDAVVGNFLVPQAGSMKLAEAESASITGAEKFVGKIIANETIGTTNVVGGAGSVGSQIEFVVVEIEKA